MRVNTGIGWGRAALLLAVLSLAGCSAISTSVAKRDLNVQTKVSDTIFLQPAGPEQKVIWLRVRNTSDKPDFEIEQDVRAGLEAEGYRITEYPDRATYWLDAVVKSVTDTSTTGADSAANAGFGGALLGGALGAGVSNSGDRTKGAVLGAVVAGLASAAIDAAVKDTTYMAVVDVQITEKARKGVSVRTDAEQNLGQGTGGSQRQTSSSTGDAQSYQTRIVATANKANLKYEEAAAPLRQGIVRALSGMF